MSDNVAPQKRSRGRPKVRDDDETKLVIIEAANEQFKMNGYASTNIGSVAKDSGTSTKTLYRLFPTKADLFSEVVSAKIGRFLFELDERSLADLSIREGLERLLIAYGHLTLSAETITMTRLVLSESDRFPEIAAVFYEQAIARTSRVMEAWLQSQANEGILELLDARAATGMLRGMMTMEPQRAVMLGRAEPPTESEIVQRAATCANLFLNGCEARERMGM